jgi:hypothetical protein
MKKRKKPARKPSQPLSHVSFLTKGGALGVIEKLPYAQGDLEVAIIRKFAGGLKHFKQRELTPLTRGNPWPDFLTYEGAHHVGVEVVEVLDVDNAKKRAIQEQYEHHLHTLIVGFCSELAGLSITIVDQYQEPRFPPLNSRRGQQLAQSLADNLQSLIPRLRHLPVGCLLVIQWQCGGNQPQSGAAIKRLTSFESQQPPALGFSGNFPTSVNNAQTLLLRAIEGKLHKNYPRYQNGRLWLLAYSYDPCILQPKAIAQAKFLLESCQHPFDEVWCFFPYAAQDLGAIEKVWP